MTCWLWDIRSARQLDKSQHALPQIPIAMLGLLFFDAKWSPQNLASILVGLLAGVVFVRAKQLEAPAVKSTGKADPADDLRLKAGLLK